MTKKFPGEKVEKNPVVTHKKTVEVPMVATTKTLTKPVGSKKVSVVTKILVAHHPEIKPVGKKEVFGIPETRTISKTAPLVDIKSASIATVLRHPATLTTASKPPAEKVIKRKPKQIDVFVRPIITTRRLKPDVEKVQGLKMVAPRLFASIYPFLHVFPYGRVPQPLHVVFVIDNSQNMQPMEFNYVRRFLHNLLHKRRQEWRHARFGVVTTATPETLFGLLPVGRARRLLPKLERVEGVSKLPEALLLALQAHESYPERHAKKVAFVISANTPSFRNVSIS